MMVFNSAQDEKMVKKIEPLMESFVTVGSILESNNVKKARVGNFVYGCECMKA